MYLFWLDNLVIDFVWDIKGKIYVWCVDFLVWGVDNWFILLKF